MTMGIERILCAIDLSPNSESVLLRAVLEARAHDARIHLMHIIPSFEAAMAIPIVSFMGEERFIGLIEENKEEVRAGIMRRIDKVREKTEATGQTGPILRLEKVHVYEGDAVVEILDMAVRLKADMIVMGTHGKGLTEHTFMGSVARKVVKRAKVPVLLVPPVPPAAEL